MHVDEGSGDAIPVEPRFGTYAPGEFLRPLGTLGVSRMRELCAGSGLVVRRAYAAPPVPRGYPFSR